MGCTADRSDWRHVLAAGDRTPRRQGRSMLVCLGLLLAPASLAGQEAADVDDEPWALLRTLEGAWEGDIAGKLGTGTGSRIYEFVLDDQFLLVTHASVRLPQPESPKGDHHREMGVYSHDRSRGAIIYRQFIVEGYVLEYVCDTDRDARRLVCTTESVENGEGMRARETIHISSDHSFDEVFELASDGNDLEVYFTNQWRRRPSPGGH